jgi:hypothetical protein
MVDGWGVLIVLTVLQVGGTVIPVDFHPRVLCSVKVMIPMQEDFRWHTSPALLPDGPGCSSSSSSSPPIRGRLCPGLISGS